MKSQKNHVRHDVRLILALLSLMCSVALLRGHSRLASAQVTAPSWSFTGSLNTAHGNHTATLLPNGKVLVAGGYNTNSAELYDPATGAWSNTGNLNTARAGHKATLLLDGKVLVAGGYTCPTGPGPCSIFNTAELYDPTTGTWGNTGSLNTARTSHTATLLPNGKVLVAGGANSICQPGGPCVILNTAELYDPATGMWTDTGNLTASRSGHTATLLSNGKVLVAGGGNAVLLNNAELYDPVAGAWANTTNLNAARAGHTATLLANGKVLVTGNYQRCNDIGICEDPLDAELYDPLNGSWSTTDYPGIYDHTATLLPSGNVLLVANGNHAQLYDPIAGTFSITVNSNTERYSYTATLLPTGKVLLASGFGGFGSLYTAELYDPGTNSISNSIADFDGDGESDISVFRPSNGVWYLQQSTNGHNAVQFGLSTDTLAPADYDGDGKTDITVYRSGTWYLLRSTLGFTSIAFGEPSDIPQPADFDGDGKAELAVFRPSNGTWYVLNLVSNQSSAFQFGVSTDRPVVGDYDGDGKADYAVYRDGTWYLLRSLLGVTSTVFGVATDKPVLGDYDGDGKIDIAVYRPSDGTWYLQQSTAGFRASQFGISTDLPAPADYDGDGKTDIAVFRDGNWYLLSSTQGFTAVNFGLPNDKPIPNAFVP